MENYSFEEEFLEDIQYEPQIKKLKNNKRLQDFSKLDKIALIEAIKEQRPIWDLQSRDHSNMNAINRAWNLVAEAVGKGVTECKAAWKSIRQSHKYHTNNLKKKKSGSSGGTPSPSPSLVNENQWEFFEHLDFLEETSTKRRTFQSIENLPSTSSSGSINEKNEKSYFYNTTKLRLQGFNQFKWKHRKALQKITSRWAQLVSKLELWHSSLKQIEGHFGTGVVAYFLFLRSLFFLNCLTFILIFVFLVFPHILLQQQGNAPSEKCDGFSLDITLCKTKNEEYDKNNFYILDIIQGSGILQSSLMFYGAYSSNQLTSRLASNEQHSMVNSNTSLEVASDKDVKFKQKFQYNLPLAYIFVTTAYFVVVLLAIVRGVAYEFKDRLINGKCQFYQHCNLVFGGWDFCIHNEKSANIKHKAIYNELKSILLSKRIEIERSNRSTDFMLKLVLVRIIVNVTVLSILAISAYFIYFLFNISVQHQILFESKDSHGFTRSYLNDSDFHITNSVTSQPGFVDDLEDTEQQIIKFLFDFTPFIAIVGLNLFVPIIFNYLCTFEKYSPLFVVKISLFRTIFLRLASLGVLLSRFYYAVVPQPNNQFENKSSTHECWETFVGQQFYKLVIADFVSHLLVTFCINFPRSLCARSVDQSLVRLIGEQEFELPKHVLDIVYLQTICWLGSFYAPLLPAIVAMITFFMFYIKKFQCLVNSKPSKILYGTSRSNSLFMFILLLSFIIALVPVTYAIAEIKPSLHCGPFRGFSTVWSAPLLAFTKMPEIVKNFIFFFGTAGFAIPCFVVLTLLLYYFYAVSDANKNMVEVLRNQLILEGHDKQFLLNRLSVFLKQQGESPIAQTRTEVPSL